jgi:hypothetical protein
MHSSGGQASAGAGSSAGGASSAAGAAPVGPGNSGGQAPVGGAGAGSAGGPTAGSPAVANPEVPSGYVPALIGVGYGGIRIVSRDGGSTWGDRASFSANGGDDENLLRAVVYGKGKWIATGWKLVTSNDGKVWTDHGLINEGDFLPCNIVEGLAYADGWFYAACSGNPSTTYRSLDGLDWAEYGTIGNTDGHLFLTYRDGKFVAYGDNERSFESEDASTFTELSGVTSATFCEGSWKTQNDCFDAAWFDGTYLRADWQGKISRSAAGDDWTTVYTDDQQNTLYRARAMAQGYVAP